jgi:hypothetical protein
MCVGVFVCACVWFSLFMNEHYECVEEMNI